MKKIVLICLAFLSVLGILTGTFAYFTDTIETKAVIASGELSVLQHEYEYAQDGSTLQPYTQNQVIYPGVKVDKIVTVENVGKNMAYVRTFVAVPTAGNGKTLAALEKGTDPNWVWCETPFTGIEIDQVPYDIFYATYTIQLAPGSTTPPCMTGFTVSPQLTQMGGQYVYLDASSSSPVNIGNTFSILVATNASQAIVFENAEEAMVSTFGSMQHPWEKIVWVSTQKDLDAKLKDAPYNTCIHLKSGTYALPAQLPDGIRIGVMSTDVFLTNTSLSGYDIEVDGVTFTNSLSFTGHGSFQKVCFQKECTASPTSGDILFDHCTGVPVIIAPSVPGETGGQVIVKN